MFDVHSSVSLVSVLRGPPGEGGREDEVHPLWVHGRVLGPAPLATGPTCTQI